MSNTAGKLTTYAEVAGNIVLHHVKRVDEIGSMTLEKGDLLELSAGSRIVISEEEWVDFNHLELTHVSIGDNDFPLIHIRNNMPKALKMAIISAEHVAERGVVLALFVNGTSIYFSEASAVAVLQDIDVGMPEGFEKAWENTFDEVYLRSQSSQWFLDMKNAKSYGKVIVAGKSKYKLLGFANPVNKNTPARLCEHYNLQGISGGYELSDIHLYRVGFFPILDLYHMPSKYVASLPFQQVNWKGRQDEFIRVYEHSLRDYKSLRVEKDKIGILPMLMLSGSTITVTVSLATPVVFQILQNGMRVYLRDTIILLRYDKQAKENPMFPTYEVSDSKDCLDSSMHDITLREFAEKALRSSDANKLFVKYIDALLDKYII